MTTDVHDVVPAPATRTQVSVQWVLQVLTIGTVVTGGVVGKNEASELRASFSEARLQNATLQATLESLDSKLKVHESRPHVGAEKAIEAVRARTAETERKVDVLQAELSSRRRRR